MAKRNLRIRWTISVVIAVSLTLGVAHAMTKNRDYDPAKVYSQSQLIALFKATCLAHFPDAAAVARAAEKQGFRKSYDDQWSIGNTSVNVLVDTSSKRKLCIVDGRAVPVEGLAQRLAQDIGAYQPGKLRIGANGRRLTGRLVVNGTKVDLKSASSGSAGSPFLSTTISIETR